MGRTFASSFATDTSDPRMRLIALGAVGLVSCAPNLVGAPCANDSNCPTGQYCVGSACGLHPPDGSVGGGGGSSAGGGAGGGAAAPVCAPSCQPWMDCVGSGDAGSCLDVGLSLKWLAPAPNQKVGPMATVSLQAVQRDGGLFTRDVPYALEDGGEGTLHRLEAFQAVVDMGKQSTVRTLHAGWTSGPDASDSARRPRSGEPRPRRVSLLAARRGLRGIARSSPASDVRDESAATRPSSAGPGSRRP